MRRDLRLADNRALLCALEQATSTDRVAVAFIFDQNILERLEYPSDRRVAFLHRELHAISERLKSIGGQLLIGYGDPQTVWNGRMDTWHVQGM